MSSTYGAWALIVRTMSRMPKPPNWQRTREMWIRNMLKTFFKLVVAYLKQGNTVEIPGLGRFERRWRPAHQKWTIAFKPTKYADVGDVGDEA